MFVKSRISSSPFLLALAGCALVGIADISTSAQTANYCSICNGMQTMCRYPSSAPSKSCQKYVNEPLTAGEIKSLVNRHNELRTRVAEGRETAGNSGPQPPATDMKALAWDPELARVAQRWADQCAENAHDDCRSVDRFYVGQNVVTVMTTGNTFDPIVKLVDPWYNEVKMFNRADVSKYRFESSTGHYTQLVWGQTSSIGCGKVRFYNGARGMNTLRLICNYGPGGNVIGQRIYTAGKTASGCTRGKSKAWPSLCN
ncbi:venom allergen 3-like [Athalia rosae]|uniref:venom allergen 3-like n=1 Tax=Athalia rosae TaxID=37344 RepID=UPI0020344AAF|nr:venom allergen 3-like [Athalia rosae]